MLQNLALHDRNVDALVGAGAVAALAPRLALGEHPLGREGAADVVRALPRLRAPSHAIPLR
jgi:hypothetical protein